MYLVNFKAKLSSNPPSPHNFTPVKSECVISSRKSKIQKSKALKKLIENRLGLPVKHIGILHTHKSCLKIIKKFYYKNFSKKNNIYIVTYERCKNKSRKFRIINNLIL
jgi:hypothetical protein